MEYELPDPRDDDDDPGDDGGTHIEIQGVDAENPEQEPTMIGDEAPHIAVHTALEHVPAQPMEPAITTPPVDPAIGEVADATEERRTLIHLPHWCLHRFAPELSEN